MGLILKQWTVGMAGVSVAVAMLILKEGDVWFRKGVRGGSYRIDKSEDGGVSWIMNLVVIDLEEDSIIMDIDDGVEGYRQIVRDGYYCIDVELSETGFDGDENTDWENIYSTT